MSAIRLSVCIPIYNCVDFVGQALDSILPQTDDKIEVIVYDGGSTDGAAELIATYLAIWPNLQYHRGLSRGGIDIDMVKCVNFARGEYIWLFSGDDVMRPGAMLRALSWLEIGDDVYLCAHSICDRNMMFVRTYPMHLPNVPIRIDLADSHSRSAWFESAMTTEPFFSFMSSLLVRRDKWNSGRLEEEFIGSCWGHVSRLFGLISTSLRVCYVAETWLDMRGGNDSFLDKGTVNRFGLAIQGYQNMADRFFGHHSSEAFNIRRVLRNEFTISMFMYAKKKCIIRPDIENKDLLDELVRLTYSDGSFKERLSLYVYRCPSWFFELAKVTYRKTMSTAHHMNRFPK